MSQTSQQSRETQWCRLVQVGRQVSLQVYQRSGNLLPSLFAIWFLAAGQMAMAVDFTTDIKPILSAHCFECHGEETQESGLRLDVSASLLEGGYSGPAIVRGKSGESLLIRVILGEDEELSKMPPEGPELSREELALLRLWIDEGAPMPESTDVVDAKKKSDHWSFQPVSDPQPPLLKNSYSQRNPIDAFVLAKLEAAGVSPSIEADRATLIRRVTLDLTGLLPTIEEVDAIESDPSDDAYDRVVDRLLSSPHYGERWGRHWLDVARFAESNGYTIDGARSIWKYRDWVIDALNRDMPFDQFSVEQIAGDMLPSASTAQIIATGFHRNTMVNEEGGTDDEQFRVEAVVDRVATTGAAFLGLTLGCARCHDHKYDPVSQREFYQLFAIFNNADEPSLPLPTEEQTAQLDAKQAEISQAQKELKAEGESEAGKKKVESLKQQKKELNKPVLTTLVMRERSEPRVTNIHLRGDFLRLGTQVSANVPGVLPGLVARDGEPDRLDFANWLVDTNNPLTARVTVNRIWQRYFGQGLVATENDFGTQGDLPTHPELLDWLSRKFMEQGWSIKKLHRLIVTSATYRQSSRVREDLHAVDPYNKLLGRQQRLRLEAESIRDVALAASGMLSTEIGGPSVYPPQPEGVYRFTQTKHDWGNSEGEARYRRGMYTYLWRSSPYPFLKTFDAPDATVTCTRRPRSNTPLQALTLANDVAFFEIAQGFASDLLGEKVESDRERIELAFRRCLARRPAETEIDRLADYLKSQQQQFAKMKEDAAFVGPSNLPAEVNRVTGAAWTMLARVMLNLDEFITRE